MIGRIVRQISNLWTVLIDDKLYDCKSVGKFRHINVVPRVGDMVEVDVQNKIILDIKERKNELIRPPIANVDQAIILVSCKEPDFSSNILDKMLVVIEYHNVKPIICITKYDLLDDTKEIDDIINYYKSIGYDVFINSEKDKIKEVLKGKISVLTGQTGVGKSSLLNSLKTGLNLKTSEISKALGRGKHTTRHVELLEIEDGLVADTPGFSSLDFIGMTKEDIKNGFIEIKRNDNLCKYKDCMHIKENDCYVKDLVKENKISEFRYNNYVKFINMIDERK